MAQSKKVSFLRGKRMRVTALTSAGVPKIGEHSVVTTKGVVTLSYTTNTEEGTAITVENMGGETCVSETATPTFTGFSIEAEFCDVDFALLEMLTGQKAYVGDNNQIIGFTESTAVDLTAVNFALEMWLGSSVPSEYGYVLTPFLGGGVVGDITIENGAISFTVTGLQTKDGTGWGTGPYLVENVSGTPSKLRTAMGTKDHRRIIVTSIAPPTVYSGTTPLLDSSKPAVTGFTATPTGLSVSFSPTPAGTDPMFYDFGDGTWDYSATGSVVHVYAKSGTYSVTAKRGSSSFTKDVVVP